MDRNEFLIRLQASAERAKEIAKKYIVETLPEKNVYCLSLFNNNRGKQGPPGTIKYIGGRFLRPENLYMIPAWRAAQLLWADGKFPKEIRIYSGGLDENTTHIHLFHGLETDTSDDIFFSFIKSPDKPFYATRPMLSLAQMEGVPISLREYGERTELKYKLSEIKIECIINGISIPAEKIAEDYIGKLGNINQKYVCTISGKNTNKLFDFLTIGRKEKIQKAFEIFSKTHYFWRVYYCGKKEFRLDTIDTYEFDGLQLKIYGKCSEIKKQ